MKEILPAWALSIVLSVSFAQAQSSGWLSTPRPIGQITDFTHSYGVTINSGIIYWAKARTSDGTDQHIAGRTPAGTLQVFSWGQRVKLDNLTARPGGAPIVGSPIAWLGGRDREHVAAISSSDAVLLFTRTPIADWTAIELPRDAGEKFSGNLVSWVTRTDPPTDHVAATTTDGKKINGNEVTGRPAAFQMSDASRPGCGTGDDCVSNVCRCIPKVCDGRCGQIDQGCGRGLLNCFGECSGDRICVSEHGSRPFCKSLDDPGGCACGGRPPACQICPEGAPEDPPEDVPPGLR